jgi:uncharacterized SAM-binding protein YcdF (DUF218 family)
LRFVVAMMAFVTLLWADHRPLLQSVANAWIVSDPIAPADAVAVFGGGLDDRPLAAAEYYRQGLAKTVLISNVSPDPVENLGAAPSDVEATREILLKKGVPNQAIETFGRDLSNTHDEAMALRAWAERTGARSIIVPTEIFSTRRVRWVLDRVFGDDVVIRVLALHRPNYGRDDWWQHDEGIANFEREMIKYVFYRIRY